MRAALDRLDLRIGYFPFLCLHPRTQSFERLPTQILPQKRSVVACFQSASGLYCFFPVLCTAGASEVFPTTFAFSAADSSARAPASMFESA